MGWCRHRHSSQQCQSAEGDRRRSAAVSVCSHGDLTSSIVGSACDRPAHRDARRHCLSDHCPIERSGHPRGTPRGQGIAQGFFSDSLRHGGIDLVDLASAAPLHQLPVGLSTPAGESLTRNPSFFEAADGGGVRAYFLPDDDKATLYVYRIE